MRQVVATLLGLVLLSYGDADEYVYDIDVDGLPRSADHEQDVMLRSNNDAEGKFMFATYDTK